MALVDCPECSRQVSTLAATCPHCGFPMLTEVAAAAPRRRGPSRWTDPGFWIILVGRAAVIIMSILILRHFDDGSSPETTVPATTVGAPAPDWGVGILLGAGRWRPPGSRRRRPGR